MAVDNQGWQFLVELVHLYRDYMWITEQRMGMSQTRIEILHELWHVDELSQAQLQQRLGVEGAVVTRIVKQLEAMGLVTRRADPRDNRYTLVALSAVGRGHSTGPETIKFREEIGAQVLDGLDDAERQVLLQAMRKVGANVRALRESGGAPPD